MTKSFLAQVAERAAKTALQALVALLTADGFNLLHADWQAVAATVGTATLASVLTSLGSLNLGPSGSPSVVATSGPEQLGPPA